MWDAIALLFGLQAIERIARDWEAPVVPEPEFKPFKLSARRGSGPATGGRAPAGELAAVNTTRGSSTLEELGVPHPLAVELEAVLRVMGRVEGDHVVGFTYRTPDGVLHRLRAAAPVDAASGRAA
jgi:hypothetical protein